MECAILDRDALLKDVRIKLQSAQNRMKQIYDRGHQERTFQTGDYVYVRLQPYRQHSLAKWVSMKLATKLYGPFRVLDRIGEVAYKLAHSRVRRFIQFFMCPSLSRSLALPPLLAWYFRNMQLTLQTSNHKQPLVSAVLVLTEKFLFIGGDLILHMLLGRRSWSFKGVF